MICKSSACFWVVIVNIVVDERVVPTIELLLSIIEIVQMRRCRVVATIELLLSTSNCADEKIPAQRD